MISCLHVIQSSPERVSLECWLRSNVLNLERQMIRLGLSSGREQMQRTASVDVNSLYVVIVAKVWPVRPVTYFSKKNLRLNVFHLC